MAGGEIYDAKSGTALAKLDDLRADIPTAFSVDGARLYALDTAWGAASGKPIGVTAFDTKTGKLVATLSGDTDEINIAAISRDGKRVATTTWAGKSARVWDAATRTAIATLSGNIKPITALALSRDGALAASAAEDGAVRLWNAKTGEAVAKPMSCGAGRQGQIAGDRSRWPSRARLVRRWLLRIWNAKTGDAAAVLGNEGFVGSYALSADGARIIASGSEGDTNVARIWRITAN